MYWLVFGQCGQGYFKLRGHQKEWQSTFGFSVSFLEGIGERHQ